MLGKMGQRIQKGLMLGKKGQRMQKQTEQVRQQRLKIHIKLQNERQKRFENIIRVEKGQTGTEVIIKKETRVILQVDREVKQKELGEDNLSFLKAQSHEIWISGEDLFSLEQTVFIIRLQGYYNFNEIFIRIYFFNRPNFLLSSYVLIDSI